MVKAPYLKLYSIIKTQTMSADSEQNEEVGPALLAILTFTLFAMRCHCVAVFETMISFSKVTR